MYQKVAVPIPNVKGKIIRKKQKDSIYVLFETGRVYDPDRQFTIPQRVIIGKVTKENEEMMYPNEKFPEYFPDVAVPEELPDAYRSGCLKIGTYLVLKKIIEDYKLDRLLDESIGKDTGLLLDLASYFIIEEDNVNQHYPDFAFTHPLFTDDMRIKSDVTISRLLSSLTRDDIIAFTEAWNKRKDHKQKIYISYDSTNKNCQSGDIDILEYGKAKTDAGTPVFNVSVAYDKTNSVPLFYEEYPGSINDVSQFEYMVGKASDYGYKNIGFILDRGYFSRDNLRSLEEKDYSFIIMAKGTKKLASDIIMESKNTFENAYDSEIPAYGVNGKTVKRRIWKDDEKERWFHIYFNPGLYAYERSKLRSDVSRMEKALKKAEGSAVQFGKTYTHYFKPAYTKDGKLLGAELRKDIVEHEMNLCGYFCIITSEKMTAEEAITQYKGRDVSKKLFASDKTFLGGRSMRSHSEENLRAKIFVEFIALIIRNRFYTMIKAMVKTMEKKPSFMTVPEAINELEKIEMIRINGNAYRLDHAVTKRQKIILSSFGMNEECVRSQAQEIGKLLHENRSLIQHKDQEEPEESDEYGEDTEYCFD